MFKRGSVFVLMAAKEKEENRGQLPVFSASDTGGYFFYTNYKDGMLYYETKNCPNTQILGEVANHFKVDFTCDYSEINIRVFGQATYLNGNFKDIFLDPDDFDLFEYNHIIRDILKAIHTFMMKKYWRYCLAGKRRMQKQCSVKVSAGLFPEVQTVVNLIKRYSDDSFKKQAR